MTEGKKVLSVLKTITNPNSLSIEIFTDLLNLEEIINELEVDSKKTSKQEFTDHYNQIKATLDQVNRKLRSCGLTSVDISSDNADVLAAGMRAKIKELQSQINEDAKTKYIEEGIKILKNLHERAKKVDAFFYPLEPYCN